MDTRGGSSTSRNGGGQLTQLRMEHQKTTVQKLQRNAKENVMLAGSLVAQQVSQIAALEQERIKLASLKFKASIFDGPASLSSSRCLDPLGEDLGKDSHTRDAASQTTDDHAQVLREERDQLRGARDQLQAFTRTMPKNTVTMVDILRKRNQVLLAREERSVQQGRAARQVKERALERLEVRLARRSALQCLQLQDEWC